MRIHLTLIFAVFYVFNLTAQKNYDYNWIFGSGRDIDHNNGNYLMDFNGGELQFVLLDSSMDFWRSSSIMSDRFGELQFYSNNCFIYNKNDELLDNSEDFDTGLEYGGGTCEDPLDQGIISGMFPQQSVISLPHPADDSLYYFIRTTPEVVINDSSGYFYTDRVYYSLIDMRENEGLGRVTEKEVLMIDDTLSLGKLTAVRHANNVDWWIIHPIRNRPEYVRWLASSTGIEGPFYQDAGEEFDLYASRSAGQIVFSPDGNRFVNYDWAGEIQIYDYDRETGLLSNFLRVDVPDQEENYVARGVAISPNNRFLYTTSRYRLWQFDLEAENIQESGVLISEFEETDELLPAYYYLMQLGPDCRIYMNSSNGVLTMHVIDQPNEKGEACNFVPRGIQLPKQNPTNLPVYPHYRLGTEEPICDSTIAVQIVYPSTSINLVKERAYRFYPNPAREYVYLENFSGFGQASIWELRDLNGRLLQTEQLTTGGEGQRIELNNLAAGIYFQTVREAGQLVWRGRVVVLE